MKCKIPEISWHNRDPVLSVDIQPKSGADGSSYRLASGGTDAHVLIWFLNLKDHDIELDIAADLTRHQRAVNVVKWSPNGELLASGDDESVVFIWKQKAENEILNITETTNEQDKEVWVTLKVLRGHMEDIYDLCWSPNSQFLVSGSVDNSAMIWDVHKGKYTAMFTDHKGFVQGVTWDPKNQYVATLSTDRYLRIFDIQTKKVLHRINKSILPVPEGNELHGQRVRLFHDDTLQTFFRRLSFTPDGKFLLTPAGVADYEGATKPLHTTYLFSRFAFKQPAIVLPCPDQYTVAVRPCPILYRLRPFNPEKNPPVIALPYRMIFAVATKSSVYFYDTQQQQPFALISNIHYTRLTDITWSNDGRIVVVSSTDGFCSLITFEEGELGEKYEDSEAVLEAALNNDASSNSNNNRKSKRQKENENVSLPKSRKPSTDDVASVISNNGNDINSDDSNIQRQPLIEKVIENIQDEEKNVADVQGLKADPTPIEFRKKPKESIQLVPEETSENSVNAEEKTIETEDEKQNEILSTPPKESLSKDPDMAMPIKTPIPMEIIIDKEILSSDEKFESPEKKARPATPISVRRQPRSSSANSTNNPTTPTQFSPLSIVTGSHRNSPNQITKKATPIAIRRTPRVLIMPATPTPVNEKAVVEEAMDAWPLKDYEKETSNISAAEEKMQAVEKKEITLNKTASSNENVISQNLSQIETTSEKTEDIHLVYEDTVEEESFKGNKSLDSIEKSEINDKDLNPPSKETPSVESAPNTDTTSEKNSSPPKQQTPSNKTPRRVPLRTISTPKSKKKLLE